MFSIEDEGALASTPTDGARRLQEDLIKLGFPLVGVPDGIYGRQTECAVREFQIYAKMTYLAVEAGSAKRYVDRLSGVPNTHLYKGPVSGVANTETLTCIQHWLHRRWRCPVVVEAWNMADDARVSLHRENIWWHDYITNKSVRMFVSDFSGHYDLPEDRNPNDLIGLGRYVTYLSWGGPLLTPPQLTWPESEIVPENLVGVDLVALSGPEWSTFKVVRAVSEVECVGFFDGLNAYDNAFISLGPCHWTLGIVGSSGVDKGELCGYLAYLQHADPSAFQQAIGFFGVRTDEDWVDGGIPDGNALFEHGSRKYVGWVATEREGGGYKRIGRDEESGNDFRSWHWFYRFAMAGRTNAGWRRGMWIMARIRLRDILAAPFPRGLTPDMPDGTGGTRRATIGDIYTSERSLAVLLRWHIRFPSHVISEGQAGRHLREAFLRAAIPASAGHAGRWGDAEERALHEGLIREISEVGNDGLIETVNYIRRWPAWRGGANPRRYQLPSMGDLSTGRNSLLFDGTGLPPAPWARPGILVTTAQDLRRFARRNPVLVLALTTIAVASVAAAIRVRRERAARLRRVPDRGRLWLDQDELFTDGRPSRLVRTARTPEQVLALFASDPRRFDPKSVVGPNHAIWALVHEMLNDHKPGVLGHTGGGRATDRINAGALQATDAVFRLAGIERVKMIVAVGGGSNSHSENHGDHPSRVGESIDIKPSSGWRNLEQVYRYAEIAAAAGADRLGVPHDWHGLHVQRVSVTGRPVMSWNYAAPTNFEFRQKLRSGAFRSGSYKAAVAALYEEIFISDVQRALSQLGFKVTVDDEMGAETAAALDEYYGGPRV